MKTSVKIFRILTCIFIFVYTALLICYIAKNVKYSCFKITEVGNAYELGFESMNPMAWSYVISGIALLALCAVTAIFLFRKSLLSATISGASTVASAIYGVRLNTMLSEVTFWREPMRRLGIYDAEACLSVKPGLAGLCIAFAVCYVILFMIEYKKSQKPLGEENEQNS